MDAFIDDGETHVSEGDAPEEHLYRGELGFKGVRLRFEAEARAICHVGPFTLTTPIPLKLHTRFGVPRLVPDFTVLDRVIEAARRQGIDLT